MSTHKLNTASSEQSVGPGGPSLAIASIDLQYPPDEEACRANQALDIIHWLLRLACVCEFVGHGAFGIITKAAWVPYFGVIGIPPSIAYMLMPVIGTIDISLGILVFFQPVRAALLYMATWGLLTATIRPLAGEPIWEWLERAPNWGVPLALLYLRGFGDLSGFREGHGWSRALKSWLR
jgi:hypothetical protein